MFLSYKTSQYIYILFSPNIAHKSQGIIVLNHKNVFKTFTQNDYAWNKTKCGKHKNNITVQNKV